MKGGEGEERRQETGDNGIKKIPGMERINCEYPICH